MLCWSNESSAPRPEAASEAVVVQPPEVDAFLEIDLRVTRRVQWPLPVVVRIDVVRPDDFRLRGFFRLGHRLFPRTTFCRTRSMPRGREGVRSNWLLYPPS